MISILLIALFLGLAHAQHRCCGPAQWEAYFGQLEGYYDEKSHHPGIIRGLDFVHFDVTNKRIVSQTNLIVDGKPFNQTIYNDYTQMKQFRFDGKNCTAVPLATPMPSNCIPASANFTGSTYFGTGSDKLMLDVWQYEFPAGQLTMTMTQNGCYPVAEGIIGEFGQGGTLAQCKTPGNCVEALIAYGITGMTTGIRDASVLNTPDICLTTVETHEPIEAYSISHQLHEVRRRQA